MIEIKERQTAVFLKSKVLEVLETYGVSVEQIFSVTVDNGANMLAAVKQLKMHLDYTLLQQQEDMDMDDGVDEDDDNSRGITESLSVEFQEQLNLIKCSAHTLQLAILDVVDKSNENVKEITTVAKKCKSVKYRTHFECHNASFPPVFNQTRWGGIFSMMDNFYKQKDFFEKLFHDFPELGKLKYLYK